LIDLITYTYFENSGVITHTISLTIFVLINPACVVKIGSVSISSHIDADGIRVSRAPPSRNTTNERVAWLRMIDTFSLIEAVGR